MKTIQSMNLALRFILELCAMAALAYWGWYAVGGLAARLALGIGAPLAAAFVWGLFVAPKRAIQAPFYVRLAFELLVFGLAVAGLFAAGQAGWALALAVVYAINRILLSVWRE